MSLSRLSSVRRRVGAFAALVPLMVISSIISSFDPVRALAQDNNTATGSSMTTEVPEWVAKSNENAQVLLTLLAKFNPEMAASLGIDGLDEEIMDLERGLYRRTREALTSALDELGRRLKDEKNPAIRQDLELLIEAAERFRKGGDLSHNYEFPYTNITQGVFMGIRALLDPQVDASRYPAALVRLRRYAGMEEGYKPITELARDRTLEKIRVRTLLGPPKREVEKDLATSSRMVDGIGKLFESFGISGYEPAYDQLKKQLAEYESFIRSDVLPRSRTDFRQRREMYAFSLEQSGIDMSVEELTSRARVGFGEIQEQMRAIAPLVAKEHAMTVTDYRDVIRELKKKQIVGEAILDHYKQRIKDVEEIIRRERIVTLPVRPVRMRLATEAESAMVPAPHMSPPRMLGNTGEMGEFVLPLRIPSADGKEDVVFDDFTFDAGSWTLTAHEARPGHELQFASMIERGVSIPRALFAMNSTNIEGWGLYSEWEIKPYLPLDGQLISLQHRLLRAARAFLDPGIQLGTITPEEATRVLREEVVLSEPMVTQEVERYMFWAPGQAPSYFCGYLRMIDLRTETQLTLADKFDRMAFNDFILSQGALSPRLLRKAVEDEFIPRYRKATKVD